MKAGDKSTAARAFYKRVFDIAAQVTTEEGTSIKEEVLGQIKVPRTISARSVGASGDRWFKCQRQDGGIRGQV